MTGPAAHAVTSGRGNADIVQHDGAVIVTGDALPTLYRAVLALAARHHRDGVAPPPLLQQLRAALFRAATSPPRRRATK